MADCFRERLLSLSVILRSILCISVNQDSLLVSETIAGFKQYPSKLWLCFHSWLMVAYISPAFLNT